MSWDVDLIDAAGNSVGSWNYTHNVNPMIRFALNNCERWWLVTPDPPAPWWRWLLVEPGLNGTRTLSLDGCPGPVGAQFLHEVASELDGPRASVYEDMNPPNGWGSRASLVEVLREMVRSVPEWPTTWHASG